jgi:alkylation response protein AidB-like acyl-CoA dehydrogenase
MSFLEQYERDAAPWLERVAAVAPAIETHRDEIEAERRLPVALYETLRDAGFFRMWLPRQYGGFEVDLVTCRLVIEGLAKLDGAVAWCVGIANEGAALAAYISEEGGEDVFSDPNVLVAGTLFPPGKAVADGDGYRVSGTWPLASGSPNATWLYGNAMLLDGDTPRQTPAGTPQTGIFLMPAGECQLLDTWYSTGLRGTGSNHFEARNMSVPARRMVAIGSGLRFTGSIYPQLIVRMFAPNAAVVSLGVALGALAAFKELARSKPGTVGQPGIGAQPTVHALIARSEIRLQAARLALHEASVDTQAMLTSEHDISEPRALSNRLVGTYVAAEATDVVSSLYTAAGSTSVYQGNPLDRALRDVHTANQHVSSGPNNFAMVGSHLLNAD